MADNHYNKHRISHRVPADIFKLRSDVDFVDHQVDLPIDDLQDLLYAVKEIEQLAGDLSAERIQEELDSAIDSTCRYPGDGPCEVDRVAFEAGYLKSKLVALGRALERIAGSQREPLQDAIHQSGDYCPKCGGVGYTVPDDEEDQEPCTYCKETGIEAFHYTIEEDGQ